MDWLLLFLRLAITATFLILAAGGPWALIKLSRFIRRYAVAHQALKLRVQIIEKQLGITPPDEEHR
jgi:hypothetical protein